MTPLRVGMVLGGFCGGEFGRDSYHDKVVEAIGVDWVVARPLRPGGIGSEGCPEFYLGNPDSLVQYALP